MRPVIVRCVVGGACILLCPLVLLGAMLIIRVMAMRTGPAACADVVLRPPSEGGGGGGGGSGGRKRRRRRRRRRWKRKRKYSGFVTIFSVV